MGVDIYHRFCSASTLNELAPFVIDTHAANHRLVAHNKLLQLFPKMLSLFFP